jgi:hypothetical protein
VVVGVASGYPATVLPLDITSHSNNAQVGSGAVEVRGRTAPDAKVDARKRLPLPASASISKSGCAVLLL